MFGYQFFVLSLNALRYYYIDGLADSLVCSGLAYCLV
jgi:hypothetical protein